MPPMMVFPRKRMDPQLMLNAAPGAWGVVSDSGWMTTELFLGWFKQFVKFSGATVDRPVLLLLDGHSTHTKNIDLIDEARANGVIILCFPPHATHRLQVADVVYMRPLSNYYDRQITTWLRSNPGMVVTMRQVAEIFGKAFIETSTMATAVNGFKKCGIWPFDPTVFSETDFAPSLVTDIPLTQTLTSATTDVAVTAPAELETQQVDVLPVLDTSEAAITNATTSRASLLSTGVETEAIRKTINNVPVSATFHETPTVTSATSSSPQPGCSTWVDDTEIDRRPTTPQQSTFSVVSPQQILPLPASRRSSRVTRKRGRTAIITESPYKKELEETIKRKQVTEENKLKRKEIRQLKLEKTKTKDKKGRPNKRGVIKKKKTIDNRKSSDNNSDADIENTPCLYCSGLYLDSNEGWIKCSLCGTWAHCSCAGVDDEDDEATFSCEFCQEK
ncbi:uncharacterized protein LOC129222562 [Uloborus diversus]|uniref:uncharacterized protein LOC129222562 n=1 Tax=Uloborus diversus TaxID=327109 RepID=UPI00240A0827|nr:uncharacterized protein LOC129222562 [Uloborus diversus]